MPSRGTRVRARAETSSPGTGFPIPNARSVGLEEQIEGHKNHSHPNGTGCHYDFDPPVITSQHSITLGKISVGGTGNLEPPIPELGELGT